MAEKSGRAEIRFAIRIPPVTKKNSQRIIRCGGYHRIMPSKAYTQYEQAAAWYMPRIDKPVDEPCEVRAIFYMKTRRKVDLTNLLEALDDTLVKHGVLLDDNSKIIVSHDGSRVLYDKYNPRTEVTIRFLEEQKGGE